MPAKKPEKQNKDDKAKKKASTKKTSASKNNNAPYSKDKYDDLINETSIVFLAPETINLLKQNEKLQSTIEYFINAIYTYETKTKISDSKAQDFKTAYESLTGKRFLLSSLSKKELDNTDDEMNFLKVLIKNTLNLDWNDVVNSFKAKTNSSQVETVTPISLGNEQKTTNDNQNKQSYNNNHYNQAFSGEEFMHRNNVSMDQLADSAIKQQATMLVQKDIYENKFYKYKNKPTIFLFFKWALFSVWIITAITLIINAFSTVGLNGNTIYLFLEKQINFNEVVTPGMTVQMFLNNVVSGSGFYIQSNGVNIFGYILSLFFPFLIAWYAYIQIKNYKNDNAKFTCKTFITWILLIWLFFILLSSDFSTLGERLDVGAITNAMALDIPNQVIQIENIAFTVDQNLVGTAITLQAISNILYFVCIGISVLLSASIIITRPKIDFEKMQAKIEEYAYQIKIGNIPFDSSIIGGLGNSMNPFNPF